MSSPAREDPSEALALNKSKVSGENWQTTLWGQSAGKVHLRQAQEDYLQAEKAPLAPSRNLTTLFMTTQAAKDKVPLLPQMAQLK